MSKLISFISSNNFNKSDSVIADINNVKPQDAIVRFFLIVIVLWPGKAIERKMLEIGVWVSDTCPPQRERDELTGL